VLRLDDKTLVEHAEEFFQEKGRRAFRHFLPYVRVVASGTGVVPLEKWPHVMELVDSVEERSSIIIGKARQIGMTTILSAYAVWHAMNVSNALVLVFSKGEKDAWDFLSRCRLVWENLPNGLREAQGDPSNREQMTFGNGGRIMAFPSTEGAGRGLTPTLALMDEADRHEYLDAAYNSVAPGMADNKGQLILFSTWNPYRMEGLFQQIYRNAAELGFHKLFFGWNVRPGRSAEWYEEERKKYRDLALFQKEYPQSEEEMMAPARALAAFNLDVLVKMKQDVRPPIETLLMGNGVRANVYQKFQAGKRYAAGTDTSHGTGKDFAVTVVLDVVTGYVAADIHSNVLNPSELGVASVELLNMYDSPIWGIEDNDWGVLTIEHALNLKYKRLYHRDEGKPGWHTYDTSSLASRGSRYTLWGDLIEAIESRFITVPSAEGLAQFFTVIRNPLQRGRIEALSGGHDDYPMAVGIAWQLRGFARPAAGDRGERSTRSRRKSLTGRYGW